MKLFKKPKNAIVYLIIGIILIISIVNSSLESQGRSSNTYDLIEECNSNDILDLKTCADFLAEQTSSKELDLESKIEIIKLKTEFLVDKNDQIIQQAELINKLEINKTDHLATIALLQSDYDDIMDLIFALEEDLSEEEAKLSDLKNRYDALDSSTKERLQELSKESEFLTSQEVSLIEKKNSLESELIILPYVLDDNGNIDYVKTGGIGLGILLIFYSLYVIYEQGPDKGIVRRRRKR